MVRLITFSPDAAECPSPELTDVWPTVEKALAHFAELNRDESAITSFQHDTLRRGGFSVPGIFAEREFCTSSYYVDFRIFYRILAKEEYFWIGTMLDRCYALGALYFPERQVAVSLYEEFTLGRLIEEFETLRQVVRRANDRGSAKPVVITGLHHMMHVLWNDLPALERLVDTGLAGTTKVFATHQPMGPLAALFPALAGHVHPLDMEALARWNEQNSFATQVGAWSIPRTVRDRVTRLSKRLTGAKADAYQRQFRRRHSPIFWISVKPPLRTMSDQANVLAGIIETLGSQFPSAGFLLNGVSWPWDYDSNPNYWDWFRGLMDATLEATAHIMADTLNALPFTIRRRTHLVTDITVHEECTWSALADFYICHAGTMQNKIGWIHPVPGIIHSNTRFLSTLSQMQLSETNEGRTYLLTPDLVLDDAPSHYTREQLARRDENYTFRSTQEVARQILGSFQETTGLESLTATDTDDVLQSKSRMAIFTICSNNYLPAARILLDSAKRHHPDAEMFLCLADDLLPREGFYDPAWTVIAIDQLDIPDFRCFTFRYDIMELNTAVKPFMFQYLYDVLDFDIVLYFDPDIEVFRPLDTVIGSLRDGASFVLTPHLCTPAEDPSGPDDITIMRAGIYNLGFLGTSRSDETMRILGWWAERLRYQCINDQDRGIFVDQKFMDLVPGFAARSVIAHDPTLNVAYWNLRQRALSETPDGWFVDGKPLTFFHFSGFDPRKPDNISKHDPNFGAMPAALRGITSHYARQLFANGYGKVPADTYAYGRFASGTPIHSFVRTMFREWHKAWPDDPFETYEAFLHEPSPGAARTANHLVTNFMRYLYDRFPYWHTRVDLAQPSQAAQLVDWYVRHAARELNLDLAMIEPAAERLGRRPRQSFTTRRTNAANGQDVAVIGYLRTASGVGEVGRQTLRTLAASGLGAVGCDVALNVAAARQDESCAALLVETTSAPVQIYNVNADQLPLVVDHTRSRVAAEGVKISIPFWELSGFPEPWLAGLELMDEIWAPSRFIQTALAACVSKPVIYMPIAQEVTAPPPLRRDRFALPDDRFLFFSAFDFLSFMERKNPRDVIRAFRLAFPEYGKAGLVLKCMNGALVPDRLAVLRDEIGGHPDIHLIEGTLSRDDTLGLIGAMDAVVSLHRSEGLGLLLAEAMTLRKPVIASDYSGSREFLNHETGFPIACRMIPVQEGEYPFATRQVWAAPDVAQAAWTMRRLYEVPEVAASLVSNAAAHLQRNFSRARVAEMQARRIRLLTAG